MSLVRFSLLFSLAVGMVFTSFSQSGFVHQQGNALVDGQNQALKLQGVNLGGWLSWEGWMWGGGFDSQTKMEQIVVKESDSAFLPKFKDSIYNWFIQEKDIAKIKAIGLNCVRVPFNYRVLEYQAKANELNFKQLDSVVSWCRKAGLHVVLDMHAAPGGQNKLYASDPEITDLWSDEAHKAKTVLLWQKIAIHFKDEPTVAGYDLLNEPNIKNSDSVVALYKRIIRGIRSVDTNHLVIVQGNEFSRDFSCFSEALDANMLFSFHFYPWYEGEPKRKKTLSKYAEMATKLKVPFWCGEWGEDEKLDLYLNRNLLLTESYNISGTCYWTWKQVRYRKRPALNRMEVSKDVYLVMSGYHPKETSDSQSVLEEFLRKMNIDNVLPNPELTKLLKSLTDGTVTYSLSKKKKK